MTGVYFSLAAASKGVVVIRNEIRDFLANECGLRLSEEKTHITHVRDGFEFLGFHLETGVGKHGNIVPKIRVSREAVQKIRDRLAAVMRYRPSQESVATRIINTNAVVRGWANYYRIAHNYTKIGRTLDHHLFWTAVKAICLKEDISAKKCLRKYRIGNTVGVHEQCTLMLFRDMTMSLDYHGPKPYEPGQALYDTDEELEADFRTTDKGRPGSADLKWTALIRDEFRCQHCGRNVTAAISHADHIEPVRRFANLAQAHSLDNIQTLCLDCHKAKSREDNKV